MHVWMTQSLYKYNHLHNIKQGIILKYYLHLLHVHYESNLNIACT